MSPLSSDPATAHPGKLPPPTMKQRVDHLVHAVVGPPAGWLARLGVGPTVVTSLGLLLSLAAGIAFFEGNFRLGALLTTLGGLCDIFDGEMARRGDRASRFGAFIDSTLDRLAEAAVLCGIAGFYLGHLVDLVLDPHLAVAEISRGLEPMVWERVGLVAILALVGSYMVSYTRARAEGLGLECKVGWFERPERMVLVIVAGAFGVGPVMPAALILLALLSFVTMVQRVVHVWRNTRGH